MKTVFVFETWASITFQENLQHFKYDQYLAHISYRNMQCCTGTPNATQNYWLYDSHMKTSVTNQAGTAHWVSNDPCNKVAIRKWHIIRARWHYGPNITTKQFLHRHNQPPATTADMPFIILLQPLLLLLLRQPPPLPLVFNVKDDKLI